MNRSANYTLIWNGLDYPACAFPVTKVEPMLDPKEPPHEFLSEFDKMNYDLCMPIFSATRRLHTDKASLDVLDDPEVFSNAPVGLQLVGQRLEDEAVIKMTEIVDAALKGSDVSTSTTATRLMSSLLSWSSLVIPHGLPLVSSITGDKMRWSS